MKLDAGTARGGDSVGSGSRRPEQEAQFKYADKVGAARVLVLAGDEMSQGMVKVRDMNGGAEQLVPRDQVVSFVKG